MRLVMRAATQKDAAVSGEKEEEVKTTSSVRVVDEVVQTATEGSDAKPSTTKSITHFKRRRNSRGKNPRRTSPQRGRTDKRKKGTEKEDNGAGAAVASVEAKTEGQDGRAGGTGGQAGN